jgi:CHAT domain-containing protein
LVFGDGKVITLKELQNWKLRNAGLVILSACETGVGSGLAKSGNELGSGVEVLGIGYQVQRAGAKAVIATLWQVSDEATVKLMDNFYSELRKPNTSPTEALTRAQNILIADKKPNTLTSGQPFSCWVTDCKLISLSSCNSPCPWAKLLTNSFVRVRSPLR